MNGERRGRVDFALKEKREKGIILTVALLAIELQLCQSETSFEMYSRCFVALCVDSFANVEQNLSFRSSDLFERTIFIRSIISRIN